MATVQKIKNKIISIFFGICAAFSALIFGISFLTALTILTPVALLGYSVLAFGIRFANYACILPFQLQAVLNKGKNIYTKLASGASIFTYSTIERKGLIE